MANKMTINPGAPIGRAELGKEATKMLNILTTPPSEAWYKLNQLTAEHERRQSQLGEG